MKELGISGPDQGLNLNKLLAYKEKIIRILRSGVESLCKHNKVEIVRGKAYFLSDDRIGVENGHQFDIFQFEHALIATGSISVMPDGLVKNGKRTILSHEIFQLEEIPHHLIVYGNDYITLEVATTFHAFGSKVTLLWEKKNNFPFDESVNKELLRLLKRKKITVYKNAVVQHAEETTEDITVHFHSSGLKRDLTGTYLFMAGNRRPDKAEMGLERIGVQFTENGFVRTNENMETSVPSVYAVGDVTGPPFLAVKAIKQGKTAVEKIAGKKTELDFTFLPEVVHTIPPVVSAGLTEHEARKTAGEIRISRFPLSSGGYGWITGKKDGFIKVISDAKTDLILGIHMIGEGAVELSGHFVQLLEMAAREEDAKFPLYAHPSFNEGLLEAVEGLIGQAVHIHPKIVT